MIPLWRRRKKRTAAFDLLVIPEGEGGRTRKFHLTRWVLALMAGGVVVVCILITLLAVTFTPLMRLVPVPAAVLEAHYGKELVETEQRLKSLAEDVLILKDYNQTLRKALGEKLSEDSAHSSTRLAQSKSANEARPPQQSPSAAPAWTSTGEGPFQDLDLMTNAPSASTAPVIAAREIALPLLLPTEGFLTQGFDPSRGHLGMDIAGKQGTTIYAPTDGVVVFSGWTYEDGNILILSHGSGYMTVYKHNQMLLKTAPSSVRRGEPIALLGTSGQTSRGPHLHFEVWRDGVPQNPNQFLVTPIGVQ